MKAARSDRKDGPPPDWLGRVQAGRRGLMKLLRPDFYPIGATEIQVGCRFDPVPEQMASNPNNFMPIPQANHQVILRIGL